MNDDVKIRRATIEDLSGIKRLVTENLIPFGFKYDSAGSENDLENFTRVYQQPGSGFFVICKGEDILGSAGLVKISDSVVKLRKMYVDNSLRGKGFGLKLLTTAILEAKLLGYQTIRLETIHLMHDAIRLYTKFGFRDVSGVPESARCDITMDLIL